MSKKIVDLGFVSSSVDELEKFSQAGSAKCLDEIVTWAHMRGWESSINQDGYFEECKE